MYIVHLYMYNMVCTCSCIHEVLHVFQPRACLCYFQKVVSQCLRIVRDPPDNLDDYKTEFGYLGPALHAAVVKARSTPLPVTTASSSLTSSKPLSSTSSVFPSVSNILLYICPLFVWTSPRTYMFLEQFCGRTCMSLPVQSSYAASTAVPTVSRTVIH